VWFVIEVGIKGGRERRGFNEMEKSGECGDEILAEHGVVLPTCWTRLEMIEFAMNLWFPEGQ
jgi:hypothetical protein